MKWRKVTKRTDMPMDGDSFFAVWKGRISIAQYDDEEDAFYISFDPAVYEGNWKIAPNREIKFTEWMPLPDNPEDSR